MLVDDVRDLIIDSDGTVSLDEIDGAFGQILDLAELRFELFTPGVSIGNCVRRSAPTSPLTCAIFGAPVGATVRVRTLYRVDDMPFVHKLVVDVFAETSTTGKAIVRPYFVVSLPKFHRHADVRLLNRTLSWATPVELYRGDVDLANTVGNTSVKVLLGCEVHTMAHVESLYRGSEYQRYEDSRDQYWRVASLSAVKRYLVVDGVGAAAGPDAKAVRDAIKVRDAVTLTWLTNGSKEVAELDGQDSSDIGANSRRWEMLPRAENLLRGHREKTFRSIKDGAVDGYRYELTNVSKEPHDVEIEEDLRPARSRKLVDCATGSAHIEGDVLRLHVEVPAAGAATAICNVEYEF